MHKALNSNLWFLQQSFQYTSQWSSQRKTTTNLIMVLFFCSDSPWKATCSLCKIPSMLRSSVKLNLEFKFALYPFAQSAVQAQIYFSQFVPTELQLAQYSYGLLTQGEVCIAGYWPRLFFCKKKERTRPISSHLDRASLLNTGLLYGKRALFSCEQSG